MAKPYDFTEEKFDPENPHVLPLEDWLEGREAGKVRLNPFDFGLSSIVRGIDAAHAFLRDSAANANQDRPPHPSTHPDMLKDRTPRQS